VSDEPRETRTWRARAVRQSVLDRLMADDTGRERASSRTTSEAAFRQAVRRDLEWLLNTRRQLAEVPEGREELRRSLLRYGIPDVGSLPRDVPEARARLARTIEEAITLFEPRLTNVRVTLPEEGAHGGSAESGALRFLVDAVLRMEPEPERVLFETTFDPARHEYQVRSAGGEDA
jgi:type VI secretion system protein ImpF